MKNELFKAFSRTSSGRRAHTLLLTHPWGPQDIFDEVMKVTNDTLSLLDLYASYSCQMLSKPDTWAQWLTAEHRVAGMCLAFLVRKGHLKLVARPTRSGRFSGTYCLPGSPLLGVPKPERIVRVALPSFNLPAMGLENL